jgi:putative DNA primase/helicase
MNTDTELESYLETLGDVTEQDCMNSDNEDINDAEKVKVHNEKIRARKKKSVDKVKNKPVSIKSEVTSTDDVACSGNLTENAEVTKVTFSLGDAVDPNETPPPEIRKVEVKRPCYMVYDDDNEFGKAGVYYHGIKVSKKDEVTETNDYICDPLHVLARSCDSTDDNYGLMLYFKNQSNRWRPWLMPSDMLSAGCEELRAELLKQGLRIDHHKRNMLPSYLQSQRPKKRLECALKVGWHGDTFVLPDRVIGDRDDIFFQTDHAVTANYGQRGTLEDWKSHIAQYCVGNPLMLFQVSAGFAGPLLKKCHIEYAGFHIFDDSSTGKSTGQKIAASIWGGNDFRKTWRATGNGLEASAVLYNDCLLALDELGECEPKEAIQAIYMLGNCAGKQRANVRGTSRQVHRWNIILLSNGETTLKAHAQTAGLSVKAGQEVRFLEIPGFGKFGTFDDLHSMKDGRLFSDTLMKNIEGNYGTAGIAYLEHLVNDKQDLGELLEQALVKFITDDMTGQEKRAARAFALVAVAGELATDYSVTGWTKGDATQAVIQCFEQWRVQRGAGATEDKNILKLIRDFIDRYEDARFTSINDKEAQVHGVRAGWYEGVDPRVYYFTAAGLSDATTGYDNKRVIESLIKYGWLAKTKEGKSQGQKKIFGKNTKVYEITLKDSIEKGNLGNPTINSEVTAADHDIQDGNLGNPEINGNRVKLDTVRI